VAQRAVSNIIQERRLLEEIDSPFICNLRYAFQDDENLFMVLDLMLGGDLRFHLDRVGLMKEDVVRFYVCEMALALDYLHSKGIVHRSVTLHIYPHSLTSTLTIFIYSQLDTAISNLITSYSTNVVTHISLTSTSPYISPKGKHSHL
jgi:serine/threonine protein kinase